MPQNNKYNKCIDVLLNALDKNISLTQSQKECEVDESFCRKYRSNYIENALQKDVISQDEYNYFFELYEKVNNRNSVVVSTGKSKDLSIDDDFDKRSTYEIIRDDEGKICKYKYLIYIRDSEPFSGELDRTQMETIHNFYPYVNSSNTSSYFPYLTFIQFKKILRLFNITKDRLFPQHQIEEKNENELSELALKAKEHAAYKKIVENKNTFTEKLLKDTQKKLYDVFEDKKWIEDTIEKYYDNTRITNILKPIQNKTNIKINNITYCLFSDIHYGKKFDRPVFGRGYNKEIAHERVMEVAKKTVLYCQTYKATKLIIGFFGDTIENFLERGFHAGQVLNQDLHTDQQIFYAVDSIKEALLYIYNNLSDTNIEFHCCPGNHGRMGEDRNDDKNRTPEKIVFKILQRELKDIIPISFPDSNIINIKNNDIQLIGFHGDNSLIKRKSHEIVNLYGAGNSAYHLIISGHFHRAKIESGTNYMAISLPSIASTDEFVLEDLGYNNLAGFILGRKNDLQKAFDFSYINLY